MKPKFKTSRALFTSAWCATIALVCSCNADAQTTPFVGDVTISGSTTGDGWGLFKQGVRMGNASEALMTWFPGTSPAGTVLFDIAWADGTFTWRDTYVGATASNKMSLDAANNLLLYKASGTVGITLAPETGKITLPAGTGTSTGSGIYFGTSTAATLAASATGAAIFPSQVTLQNGLSVSSGNMNIASTTASSSSATGALTVAGGLGVGQDSYINGVRIGKGAGNVYSNTALGINVLNANTTGGQNSATGFLALRANTTGNENSATGARALYANTTGNENSATGSYALYANTTGNQNSATGNSALFTNTTGSNNVGFGNGAGLGNATGILNVFLGASAGKFQTNGTTSLSTTNRSIYIGANSRGSSNLDDNSIVIGADAIGEGANTTVLGNSLTEKTSVFGQTTLTNNPWKTRIVTVSPLADPTPATNDSGGNALVVDGHTVLNGKVIISVPQGDISMGIYQ